MHLQQRIAELDAEVKEIYSERDLNSGSGSNINNINNINNANFESSGAACVGEFDKFDAFPFASGPSSEANPPHRLQQGTGFDETRVNLGPLPGLGNLPGF